MLVALVWLTHTTTRANSDDGCDDGGDVDGCDDGGVMLVVVMVVVVVVVMVVVVVVRQTSSLLHFVAAPFLIGRAG